jgi:hypothetical protein
MNPRDIDCPTCQAPAGKACRSLTSGRSNTDTHKTRRLAARAHPERPIHPGDPRHPVAGHLTFGLDIDEPDVRRPVGPNTLGERLWPVTIERTATSTRIGYSYEAPSESHTTTRNGIRVTGYTYPRTSRLSS